MFMRPFPRVQCLKHSTDYKRGRATRSHRLGCTSKQWHCHRKRPSALSKCITRKQVSDGQNDTRRSLPLEMVELEKHTEDLNVEQNPLSALPDKWHSRFGPKEETSRPAGYTTGEVCTY